MSHKKRYQKGKPKVEEGQTIQWSKNEDNKTNNDPQSTTQTTND